MKDSALPASTHIGGVRLRVASLDSALNFYGKLLGMSVLDRADNITVLGIAEQSGQRELITLEESPGARRQPLRAAGLYHTAFLLPRRSALGHMLRRMSAARWPLDGAADHAVSEALYLSDADGNGVEIYADRPRAQWPRGADGSIAMTTNRLDLDSILAESDSEAEAGAEFTGLPSGTTVGHVHLRVPSIEEGRTLLVDVIGFDITASAYPGALFMSAGGYHHHVAVNVWESRNAPALPSDAAGLLEFSIHIPSESVVQSIAGRARAAQLQVDEVEDGVALTHAGGIRAVAHARK